jgi:hypothetical protein
MLIPPKVVYSAICVILVGMTTGIATLTIGEWLQRNELARRAFGNGYVLAYTFIFIWLLELSGLEAWLLILASYCMAGIVLLIKHLWTERIMYLDMIERARDDG